MSSKEKKIDDAEPSNTDELEERIRLSVKGALRESGKQSTFVLDSKFATDEHEMEQGLLDQLESVDFYIDQGFFEVARGTLERLEEVYPNNRLILQRLENLPEPEVESIPTLESKIEEEPPEVLEEEPSSSLEEEPPSSLMEEPMPEESMSEVPMSEESMPVEPMPVEPAAVEAEPVDVLSDALANLPELQVAYEVAVVTDEVPVITDEVPVIESESDYIEEADDEAFSESQNQAVSSEDSHFAAEEPQEEYQEEYQEKYQEEHQNEAASAETEEADYAPVQQYSEFSRSRETAPLNITDFAEVKESLKALFQEDAEDEFEPDFKIHYNVGQAYFDLGIIDDAIEEFQISHREMQTAGVKTYYYECCMMLGRCFRIGEMYVAALLWLKRAVEADGRTAEEYIKARFELASLHEEMGESAIALEIYKQIAESSPDYSDVSERIEKLQQN